jgi:hypothetical protein
MSTRVQLPIEEITVVQTLNQKARNLQIIPVGITSTGIKWKHMLIGYKSGLRKQSLKEIGI